MNDQNNMLWTRSSATDQLNPSHITSMRMEEFIQ